MINEREPDEHEGEGEEPEAFTGVYQPRRSPLVKGIVVAILVVLVLVPLVLALITMNRWDPPPDAPVRARNGNTQPPWPSGPRSP